jgi:6-phosphogluconolactonase (cycloisomerase 2 family)
MNNSTAVIGATIAGLNNPSAIDLSETDIVSVIIADQLNNRILQLWDDGMNVGNISVVGTEWAPNQSLLYPYDVYVDVRNNSNVYVSNYGFGAVILYTNMQSNNPPPRVVAGTHINYLDGPYGVYVDRQYNIIVASYYKSKVLFWPQNATNFIILAGLSAASNTSMGLNGPSGTAFDEYNSWLYVADYNNHRIQRYSINETWPCNGTTVAGGNGPGSGSHQLYWPSDIWLSKKNGAMYIADSGNNRIHLWQQGAIEGVTIAGDPNGNAGSDATMLNGPGAMVLNTNETLMYVIDSNNNRLQRFEII